MSQWRWKIAQSFEILWWKRYLRNKPKSDYLQWKTRYWRNFLHDINLSHLLDVSEEQKIILDAGCGPAGIFTVLDNHSVIGLDPLMEAYTKNVSQFLIGDYKHVSFLNQSIETARLYPDPVTPGELLSVKNIKPGNYKVAVANEQGRILLQTEAAINHSSGSLINTGGLASGMYIVSLTNEKNNYQLKFAVK